MNWQTLRSQLLPGIKTLKAQRPRQNPGTAPDLPWLGWDGWVSFRGNRSRCGKC